MLNRTAERLVLGDNAITLTGQGDIDAANRVAREMVLRHGFNARLGPVQLMRESVDYLQPQVCTLTTFKRNRVLG